MTFPAVSGITRLVAWDRVEGTTVYPRQGGELGAIQNYMVNRRTGKVEYANLAFGGPYGIGGSTHPLPWSALSYAPDQNGYVVDLDKAELKVATDDAREPALTFGHDHECSAEECYDVFRRKDISCPGSRLRGARFSWQRPLPRRRA